MNSELSLLRLFQLISPSLPIGAFTYSQGLEWAVENTWITSSDSLADWIQCVMTDGFAYTELPLLFRLYSAAKQKNEQNFMHWSQYMLACRETSEFRQEEINRARALLSLLNKLPEAGTWPELFTWRSSLLKSQVSGVALASSYWQIDLRDILIGYSWNWLENAITVGIKLIPLGQSDGQILLSQLSELIPGLVDQALNVDDAEIGASTPALAIASSLHETQYTRLFRS